MNLQEWDNTVSIISNAVTGLSVLGGVLFGSSKLDDYLKRKRNDVAFHTALALYDDIVNARGRYAQIRVKFNYILNLLDESLGKQTPLVANHYLEIQEAGTIIFESSLSIGNLFIKSNNFNAVFDESTFEKVKEIVDISNDITNAINGFFNCATAAARGKPVNQEEMAELFTHYRAYNDLTLKYISKCTDIQKIKFEEFCKFK
ncbi:hypothetical protein ISU93_13770 [Enterobacter hormaechei]|uniref:hypothetical protein n=1 Tax=Enterobacter hormaechei TaxID=158836 RepID=UPI00188BA8DA|nr:hypothetical protein [Enterobacter hormaechei]MBF4153737.1 hypothetical protein [Enterobacter hormaechei]